MIKLNKTKILGVDSIFLDNFGLTLETLSILSHRTDLNKSLKNTLRKFKKDDLFNEIEKIIEFYYSCELFEDLNIDYRIKSLHSCELKYNKYFPSYETYRVFNDLLGFRIIHDYDLITSQEKSNFRVIDMTKGKANDDGYRGVHLYYQKSKFHYPIEIQINSSSDRIFNDWMHIYVYKYKTDKEIGIYLRQLYENKTINNEKEFKEVLNNVLCGSKKV